jgi:hypothetical protein
VIPGALQPTPSVSTDDAPIPTPCRQRATGFPDPTTQPPSNIQNYSLTEGIGGVYLVVPKTINVNAPAFRQAANACDFH